MRIKLLCLFVLLAGLSLSGVSQEPEDFRKRCAEEMKKGSYKDALAYIDKALELDSSKSDFLLMKAEVLFHLAKYDDAVKYCYATLKVEPDRVQAFFLRGKICLVTGSYGGAVFFFRKVIDNAQDKELICEAYINRGNVNLKTGKFAEATADFIAAREIRHDSLDVILPLGETYYKLKQFADAREMLEKALLISPDCSKAFNLLGHIEFEQQHYAETISLLNKYLKSTDKDGEVQSILAKSYLELKDITNAYIAIYRAIQADPAESIYYKTLALIYLEKHEKEEVCNSLFHAFQLGYLEKYGYDLLDMYLTNCEQ